MNVGDKVTIWDGPRYGKTTARAVVRVSEFGKRYLLTSDGRRWQVKGIIQHEVDNRGSEIGTASIREYADGDEGRANRTMLLRSASRLMILATPNTENKLSLLGDTDLKTLGEIAERMEAAMKEGT